MSSEADEKVEELQRLWSDVQPATTSAANAAVVAVRYTAYDRTLLDIFRAVCGSEERSQRMYDLTTEVIASNAASYTAWQLRWECVQALALDLERELGHNADVVMDNPKNYQDWNHRRKCVSALGGTILHQELEFCGSVLLEDAKNYHVWAHRQHVLRACQAWKEELAFTQQMIAQDLRNNSAWNQRMFVLRGMHQLERWTDGAHTSPNRSAAAPSGSSSSTPGLEKHALGNEPPSGPQPAEQRCWLSEAVFTSEVAFTRAYILCAPNNEAAWRYLVGLCTARGPSVMATCGALIDLVEQVFEQDANCVYAWSFLVDIYESQAAVLLVAEDDRAQQVVTAAHDVMAALQHMDPIRAGYWEMRAKTLIAAS